MYLGNGEWGALSSDDIWNISMGLSGHVGGFGIYSGGPTVADYDYWIDNGGNLDGQGSFTKVWRKGYFYGKDYNADRDMSASEIARDYKSFGAAAYLGQVEVGAYRFYFANRQDPLDRFQEALDIIGFVPGIGDVVDGANALISLGRGDYGGAALRAVAIIPLVGSPMKATKEVIKAANALTEVKQYALRASKDGFYPVMKRGFANPQELTFLNKGDVWKFGTTQNPFTRYSQRFLDNTGAGLRYTEEFTGTLQEALTVERMKILNFRGQNGFLPAGNKIIR